MGPAIPIMRTVHSFTEHLFIFVNRSSTTKQSRALYCKRTLQYQLWELYIHLQSTFSYLWIGLASQSWAMLCTVNGPRNTNYEKCRRIVDCTACTSGAQLWMRGGVRNVLLFFISSNCAVYHTFKKSGLKQRLDHCKIVNGIVLVWLVFYNFVNLFLEHYLDVT